MITKQKIMLLQSILSLLRHSFTRKVNKCKGQLLIVASKLLYFEYFYSYPTLCFKCFNEYSCTGEYCSAEDSVLVDRPVQ
jgi:hypothetical protein